MSATREYLRSITMPWFLKKKFVYIVAIITLACCIPAVYFSWEMYQEELTKSRIHWNHVFAPFALPGIILLLWACIAGFWLVILLKGYQGAVFGQALSMSQPPAFKPYAAEQVYAEAGSVYKTSPGALTMTGDFRITNFRFVHTPATSPYRVQTLVGFEEPDLNFSIAHHEVHYCGFGLDEKSPRGFVIQTKNGVRHIFAPIHPSQVENAMDRLGWRKNLINGMPQWMA